MAAPRRLVALGSWLPLELALDDFIGLRATNAAEAWLAQWRRFCVLRTAGANGDPGWIRADHERGRHTYNQLTARRRARRREVPL